MRVIINLVFTLVGEVWFTLRVIIKLLLLTMLPALVSTGFAVLANPYEDIDDMVVGIFISTVLLTYGLYEGLGLTFLSEKSPIEKKIESIGG